MLNEKGEFETWYKKIAVGHNKFASNYNKWQSKTGANLTFTPLQLNTQYKALKRAENPIAKTLDLNSKFPKGKITGKELTDYNKFVDDLLKLTPHVEQNKVNLFLITI